MSTEDPEFQFNDTIYIRNINQKVGLNTLKQKLLDTFVKFHPVSVTAHKNVKMRGQAFITFENPIQAKNALTLDGTVLFDKKLEVKLAKSSSNLSIEKHLSEEEYKKYQDRRNAKKEKESSIVRINTPPDKTLVLQNLPEGITREEVLSYFDKFEGFVNLKLVEALKVGLVEFKEEKFSIPVKQQYKDLTIRESKIIINYAKK